MKSSTKKFLKDHIGSTLLIFGVTAVLLVGGFYVGYSRASDRAAILQGPDGSSKEVDAEFATFWEAWQTLRDRHVSSASTTDQDLVYGAIKGLAGSFDDPNTNFFPPEEATKFEEDVSGSFGGIGAEIGRTEGVLAIISPLKNSPAEKAGIKAGDFILRIDGKQSETLDVSEAVTRIRGAIGTTVVLTVFRPEWSQPREISIVRSRIEVPTLDLTFHEDGKVAQIQLYSFNENATREFYKAATTALASGARGIVLDLRNNPGGYLEVANALAGWFLKDGSVVVSERFKDGEDRPFVASGNEALKDMPVVVLINQGSASASEILAGALRDNRNVKLVGVRSYGKGTVQELVPLEDGSSLKVTIAHWVMPSGQILDKVGIEPDYVIELTDEDIKNKKDPQLTKALEVLDAEIAGTGVARN